MKTDWEQLREKMLRPEINKIIAKDHYVAQDACDLKILLKNMEMSYTNEMFEEEKENDYDEGGFSGARRRGRSRGSYGMFDDYSYGYSGNNNNGQSYGNNSQYNRQASGHTESEIFKHQLQNMMQSATTEESRKILKEAIDNLH